AMMPHAMPLPQRCHAIAIDIITLLHIILLLHYFSLFDMKMPCCARARARARYARAACARVKWR
ncbi:hypothetical protein AAHB54_13880, partial [Bacillus cereus]